MLESCGWGALWCTGTMLKNNNMCIDSISHNLILSFPDKINPLELALLKQCYHKYFNKYPKKIPCHHLFQYKSNGSQKNQHLSTFFFSFQDIRANGLDHSTKKTKPLFFSKNLTFHHSILFPDFPLASNLIHALKTLVLCKGPEHSIIHCCHPWWGTAQKPNCSAIHNSYDCPMNWAWMVYVWLQNQIHCRADNILELMSLTGK